MAYLSVKNIKLLEGHLLCFIQTAWIKIRVMPKHKVNLP